MSGTFICLKSSRRVLWVMKELIIDALPHTLSHIPKRVPFVINSSNYWQLCCNGTGLYKWTFSFEEAMQRFLFYFLLWFPCSCLYSQRLFFFSFLFLPFCMLPSQVYCGTWYECFELSFMYLSSVCHDTVKFFSPPFLLFLFSFVTPWSKSSVSCNFPFIALVWQIYIPACSQYVCILAHRSCQTI